MIVTDAVASYLASLRAEPDPVLAEMENHGAREGIPIVVPETGQLLRLLVQARGAQRVVEVGTAIGVSTLYMARALPAAGRLISFEVDEARHHAARGYLERAGVLDRVELRLQDARVGLRALEEPVDVAFIDGVKTEYGEYLDLVLPLLGDRGVLTIDNVLMSGSVAQGRGDGHWTDDQVATARALNERVISLEGLEATVLPVGDGVLLAVRR